MFASDRKDEDEEKRKLFEKKRREHYNEWYMSRASREKFEEDNGLE